jgi:hypothetical protein
MSERTLLRTGAGALVIGGVLGFVFNLLHPRSTAALESVKGELRLAADSSAWVFIHYMLEWAIVFGFVGLVIIAGTLATDAGMNWARLARAAVIAATGVLVVAVAVDGMATKEVADSWAGGGGAASFATAKAVSEISLALFTAGIGAFFGIVPVLFGLAGLVSAAYPRWLAYVALAAGVLGFVSASVQFLAGATVFGTLVLFTIGSLLFTVWTIAMGWYAWRMSEAPVTAGRPAGAIP